MARAANADGSQRGSRRAIGSSSQASSALSTARLPEAVHLLRLVTNQGSLAAAARSQGKVPSALSYQLATLEQELDVLLVDRHGKRARLTAAGIELLREGERLLKDLAAVATRVRRVATGWESQLTVAVDSIIIESVVLGLCQRFLESEPPTRLRLQHEVLNGTYEALASGRADLAIGLVLDTPNAALASRKLGEVEFVFAVAPGHPLTQVSEPLSDAQLLGHRIIAVADSARGETAMSVGILPGQDVLTVSTMQSKLHAQLLGLGCGFLPFCLAKPHIDAGRLVLKVTERRIRRSTLYYAWHAAPEEAMGKALRWWLQCLAIPRVREALLESVPSST